MNFRALNLLAILALVCFSGTAYAGRPPVKAADSRSVTGLEASETNPGTINPPPLGTGTVAIPSSAGALKSISFAMWPGGFMANPVYVVMGSSFTVAIYGDQPVQVAAK